MNRLIAILILTGATALNAATATREVTTQTLMPKVTVALQQALAIENAQLVLETTRPLAALKVPEKANVAVKIVAGPPAGAAAFMRTRYAVLVDGQSVGEWDGFFKAQLFKHVWVTGQIASRSASLDTVKLERKRVNVIHLREGVWEGQPDATHQLTQGISAGQILQPRHVRRTPAVLRNQPVKGVYSLRALTILLDLVALEDGAPGEYIKVRNTKSFKVLRAKVIDKNSVQLNN